MLLSDLKKEKDFGLWVLLILKMGTVLKLKLGFLEIKKSEVDEEAAFMVIVAEESIPRRERERDDGSVEREGEVWP